MCIICMLFPWHKCLREFSDLGYSEYEADCSNLFLIVSSFSFRAELK